MHTIKFRGVRKDNNEEMFGQILLSEGKAFIVDQDGEWNVRMFGKELFDDNYLVEIYPDSVAMWTLQYDKNKTEIYGSVYINGELTKGGDIVSFYYKGKTVKCEIVFNKSEGMFSLKWADGYLNQHSLNSSKYEVIGSAFSNPELLK